MSPRKYSARVFTRGAMHCPRCRAKFPKAVEACPHCKFDLATCGESFPFAAPPLSLLLDPSQLLPEGIEKDLKKPSRKLCKRFPRIEISFCFVRLQAGVATQEFAFWLHNSAPDADESRAWKLLVVGDLTSGRLALTTGYALEPFVKNELWEAAMQELAACIADEQWKEGLAGFINDARVLLTAAWHGANQRRQKNLRREEDGPDSENQGTRPPRNSDPQSVDRRKATEEPANS